MVKYSPKALQNLSLFERAPTTLYQGTRKYREEYNSKILVKRLCDGCVKIVRETLRAKYLPAYESKYK